MLFQTLDAKKECVAYYLNGEFHYDEPNQELTKTWDYTPSLGNHKPELARIYCGGKTLTEVCPLQYKTMWEKIKEKLHAFRKSFASSKLNLDEVCLYELLPEPFLFELYDLKNEITKHVFETYSRPQNYDHIASVVELLGDIKQHPVKVNLNPIRHKLGSTRGRNFMDRVSRVKKVCGYNPWGTITGRLAGIPGTFPILTLDKEFRGCLSPQNDWYIELDYNAAEVRTLLALSGETQPQEDIHAWNVQNIYDSKTTRDEAKTKIFAWLYSKRSNQRAEKYYNKSQVLEKYWDGHNVTTDFKREIKDVDNHHALNYIIQSTTVDMVHEQAYKIYNILKGKKSHIAFLIHDAVYIDLAEEDRYELLKVLDIFKKTRYGIYKVNVSAGKTLGAMKELRL